MSRPARIRGSFDAERAFGYLAELCAIGPRVSGTSGMERQRERLVRHLEPLADHVSLDHFKAQQRSRPGPVNFANLTARWFPERSDRVLLCTHYDTRPIADREPDPSDWGRPFLGANDGASGVALLMELAVHLRGWPIEYGVDLVCFDGEEYIFDPEVDDYLLGSSHFAGAYDPEAGGFHYRAAILLDMIGGRGARFPVEIHSALGAGQLVAEIWGLAEDLGCSAFVGRYGHAIVDDHLPLLAVGIPAIDIIDLDYPHWHRLSDTLANCSAESLEQVARVLISWLCRRP